MFIFISINTNHTDRQQTYYSSSPMMAANDQTQYKWYNTETTRHFPVFVYRVLRPI